MIFRVKNYIFIPVIYSTDQLRKHLVQKNKSTYMLAGFDGHKILSIEFYHGHKPLKYSH